MIFSSLLQACFLCFHDSPRLTPFPPPPLLTHDTIHTFKKSRIEKLTVSIIIRLGVLIAPWIFIKSTIVQPYWVNNYWTIKYLLTVRAHWFCSVNINRGREPGSFFRRKKVAGSGYIMWVIYPNGLGEMVAIFGNSSSEIYYTIGWGDFQNWHDPPT